MGQTTLNAEDLYYPESCLDVRHRIAIRVWHLCTLHHMLCHFGYPKETSTAAKIEPLKENTQPAAYSIDASALHFTKPRSGVSDKALWCTVP